MSCVDLLGQVVIPEARTGFEMFVRLPDVILSGCRASNFPAVIQLDRECRQATVDAALLE